MVCQVLIGIACYYRHVLSLVDVVFDLPLRLTGFVNVAYYYIIFVFIACAILHS